MRTTMWMTNAMCAAVMIIGSGCSETGGAKVQEIKTAKDLQTRIDVGDVMVVHSLNAESYAKGHVPGATNIDYESMTPQMLPENMDKPLVFYCAGPMCPVGERAAEKAAGWGHKHVMVYKGGMSDWRAAGMPVETTAH